MLQTESILRTFFRDVTARLNTREQEELNFLLINGASQNQLNHFLEEHNVDSFLRDQEGNTIVHLLVMDDTAKLLSKPLRDGVDVRAKNDHGQEALHFAAKSKYSYHIKKLVEQGADVNTQCQAKWTALHYAVASDQIENVRLLLDLGANLELRNQQPQTALDLAIDLEHYEIAAVLSKQEKLSA